MKLVLNVTMLVITTLYTKQIMTFIFLQVLLQAIYFYQVKHYVSLTSLSSFAKYLLDWFALYVLCFALQMFIFSYLFSHASCSFLVSIGLNVDIETYINDVLVNVIN